VKLVNVDDASTLAYQDTANVVGQVTRFPIAANEQVLSTKVVALSATPSVASKSLSFVVPTGMRAIAIDIRKSSRPAAVTAGRLRDILVVYDIEFANPFEPKEREGRVLLCEYDFPGRPGASGIPSGR
jgi:hypothetical protein